MRGRLLAVALAGAMFGTAVPASAGETCIPTDQETPRVMDTMTHVKDPDMASLAAGQTLIGCGLWSLQISADGKVKALKLVRSEGGEPLRKAVEPWIAALRFEARDKDWTGLMPVTLEGGGKK